MTTPGQSTSRLTPRTLGALVLTLWVVLMVVYFLRSNAGLLPGAHRPLGVFQGLLGQWSFSLVNSPPLEVLQALVALGLTHGFGLLLTRALRVQAGCLERHGLAFILGFGVSGIAWELLTMARLLYPVATWLVWAMLLGGAWWAGRPRPGEQPAPMPDSVPMPRSKGGRGFVYTAFALFGLITLTTFWHALFYPETYWDGLILYLGYARMTFLEHGFPFKAEAQVGIGLGANYPHLYPTFGAVASMMFDHWSDVPHRLAAPLAGLFSGLLVYTTALHAFRRHVPAAAAMLLFRAVPNGIAYTTFASDYAFAILFCAAFLAAFAMYTRRRGWGELAAFTLIPACAMHLNFLMGILWVPWLAGVLAVQGWGVLRSRRFWAIYLIGVALALPWYIRNTILTGNPVYAFFPEIFTASVRVNPEVLRSAELEWFRVGDGVGKTAEFYRDVRTGTERSEADPDYRRTATVRDRLDSSWFFWTGYDVFRLHDDGARPAGWAQRLLHLTRVTRFQDHAVPAPRVGEDLVLLHWNHAYKMAPLAPGFYFPAVLLVAGWLVYTTARGRWRRQDPGQTFVIPMAWLMSLLLMAYMYLLADFYLYQIIGILPAMALLGAFLVDKVIETRPGGRVMGAVLMAALIVHALIPGLAFGLMNFKFFGNKVFAGQQYNQGNLDVFRNPGIEPAVMYRLRFDRDPDMWDFVNATIPGERLLTHENRHYVYDPSITIVQLDDWDMQQCYYPASARELYQFLRSHDLRWYLRIPNEKSHIINSRLGMDMLEAAGGLREVFRAGDNVLFEIVEPTDGP